MTVKKNATIKYISNMPIKINWSQVITSLLIGGVLGVIGVIRLSDSQTTAIAGQGQDIVELKESVVLRAEYAQTILRIDQRLNSIDQNNQSIDSKLTRLLERD
jgi:hypothetical protein